MANRNYKKITIDDIYLDIQEIKKNVGDIKAWKLLSSVAITLSVTALGLIAKISI